MKTLFAIIFLGASSLGFASQKQMELDEIPTFPVNTGKTDVENTFTEANPYYKQRAGTFYETKYLGFAAERLFELADIEPRKRVASLDAIRGFIYDWLDFKTRDDGHITPEHHDEALSTMNRKFQRLLSPLQLKIYEVWRDDMTGEANSLGFLMNYDAKGERE